MGPFGILTVQLHDRRVVLVVTVIASSRGGIIVVREVKRFIILAGREQREIVLIVANNSREVRFARPGGLEPGLEGLPATLDGSVEATPDVPLGVLGGLCDQIIKGQLGELATDEHLLHVGNLVQDVLHGVRGVAHQLSSTILTIAPQVFRELNERILDLLLGLCLEVQLGVLLFHKRDDSSGFGCEARVAGEQKCNAEWRNGKERFSHL